MDIELDDEFVSECKLFTMKIGDNSKILSKSPIIEGLCEIGKNSVIGEGVIMYGPKIGNNVIIGNNVLLHGCYIHDNVRIGNNSRLLFESIIGYASILENTSIIGSYAVLEAYSKTEVTEQVTAYYDNRIKSVMRLKDNFGGVPDPIVINDIPKGP